MLSGEASSLEAPFSEYGIKAAIDSLGGDKAPSLDGFPIAFFQNFWQTVRKDVMEFIYKFFERGWLSVDLGALFMVLIPKLEGGSSPRLLSSIKGLMLWVARFSTAPLSPTNASTLDTEKGSGLVCKLDLEKAYNHVDWEFLDYMLARLVCGQKWRGWMRKCVQSATFLVMVNGLPNGFSKDPLTSS
ncbi:uncharacterized protein LOC131239154 [Magnolia sinica]|uniref:uncharacterized protein LOC131239154 n=1 Tax=Magnolia sinica TaxID=86752 RepID=UPI00265B2F03|nr:uncharacterized protein LOC131239154 [Magnolia sinica]